MGWIRRYSVNNFRALVDAVVPETPELADRLGEQHRSGAVETGLEEYLVETFNSLQELESGWLGSLLERWGLGNVPASLVMALLLDVMALEFCLRGRHHQSVESSWTSFRILGLYRDLAPRDRVRVLRFLEEGSLLQAVLNRVRPYFPQVGLLKFMATVLAAFPLLTYYSEWSRVEREGAKEESKGTRPIGWEQADYPGPADGYADFRGYELDSFEENEYR